MRKLFVCLVLLVILAGCDRDTDVRELESGIQEGRMRMASIQAFEDSRGYYRNVVILVDTETGVEYLAVLGAGVTEMRVCRYDVALETTVCETKEE